VYKAEFENGLTEHELDFIYTGTYNANPLLNFAEANCYKWMSLEEVKTDMHVNPNKYTAWFKIIFDRYLNMVK
jgi:isopentenyl-diphosphate delta-isomerase